MILIMPREKDPEAIEWVVYFTLFAFSRTHNQCVIVTYLSIILWKHRVNLSLQSFRSAR